MRRCPTPDPPARSFFASARTNSTCAPVSCRRAGHRIDLPDQPFAVLSVLLEHAGQLVTREELRARLWPNATPIHFEQGVDYAIRRLREALQDDAAHPEFIETIPRRGYRFVAPVETAGTGADERSAGDAGSTPPEHGAALPAADDRYELLEMIGAGGMGEAVPRAGYAARSRRRRQVPPAVAEGRSARAAPVPSRGARGRGTEPPEHPRGARPRPAQQRGVHRV